MGLTETRLMEDLVPVGKEFYGKRVGCCYRGVHQVLLLTWGSRGINEGRGFGVNGSSKVVMHFESSSVQRVEYHLGDQYLHQVVDWQQKIKGPMLNLCFGTPMALLENGWWKEISRVGI